MLNNLRNIFTEWGRQQAVHDVLSDLERYGIEKLAHLNNNQKTLKEEKEKLTRIIEGFRSEINARTLLDETQRIRIVHKRTGLLAPTTVEHTRNILNITMENIGEEKQALENARNFAIAIISVALACAAVVLASFSAIFDFLSFLFSGK